MEVYIMNKLFKVFILLSFLLSVNLTVFAGSMEQLLIKGAMSNNIDMIKMALDNGANINYKDNPESAINFAVMRGHLEAVDFLIKNGARLDTGSIGSGRDNMTNLMLAVYNYDYPMTQLLIKAGENINAVNYSGNTALTLHLLGVAPKANMVKALVDAKANVNKANRDGMTPLMLFSAFSGKSNGAEIECLQILLNAGADPSARDNHGKTALDYAIERNNIEAINILLPISPKN